MSHLSVVSRGAQLPDIGRLLGRWGYPNGKPSLSVPAGVGESREQAVSIRPANRCVTLGAGDAAVRPQPPSRSIPRVALQSRESSWVSQAGLNDFPPSTDQ
jgi:hypothetical protein